MRGRRCGDGDGIWSGAHPPTAATTTATAVFSGLAPELPPGRGFVLHCVSKTLERLTLHRGAGISGKNFVTN